MFGDPQEYSPVCSYQCAFTKCAADAAVGVDSAGCTPLHLAVWSDGDSVIERVQTLPQSALDATLMTNVHGHTPLNSPVFWFSAVAILTEIFHIPPTCVSIRPGSGAWREGGGGRPGSDHAGADLRGSQLRIQIQLLGDGRADREGIGLRYHSRDGSFIR